MFSFMREAQRREIFFKFINFTSTSDHSGGQKHNEISSMKFLRDKEKELKARKGLRVFCVTQNAEAEENWSF
jgi:hypothetical protein